MMREYLGLSSHFLQEAFHVAKEILNKDNQKGYATFYTLLSLDPTAYDGYWLGFAAAAYMCSNYQEAAGAYTIMIDMFPQKESLYSLAAESFRAAGNVCKTAFSSIIDLPSLSLVSGKINWTEEASHISTLLVQSVDFLLNTPIYPRGMGLSSEAALGTLSRQWMLQPPRARLRSGL